MWSLVRLWNVNTQWNSVPGFGVDGLHRYYLLIIHGFFSNLTNSWLTKELNFYYKNQLKYLQCHTSDGRPPRARWNTKLSLASSWKTMWPINWKVDLMDFSYLYSFVLKLNNSATYLLTRMALTLPPSIRMYYTLPTETSSTVDGLPRQRLLFTTQQFNDKIRLGRESRLTKSHIHRISHLTSTHPQNVNLPASTEGSRLQR